jgi:hypothetical protein
VSDLVWRFRKKSATRCCGVRAPILEKEALFSAGRSHNPTQPGGAGLAESPGRPPGGVEGRAGSKTGS